jgi:hypothetical protein
MKYKNKIKALLLWAAMLALIAALGFYKAVREYRIWFN